MSTIAQITFKSHRNCGNFESFEVEATVVLDVDDVPGVAAQALQTFVDEVCLQRLDQGKKGKRRGMDAGELVDDLP